MHRLGDSVEVRLVEAAPLAGALRFELLSEGSVVPRSKRPEEKPKGRTGQRARQVKKKARRG